MTQICVNTSNHMVSDLFKSDLGHPVGSKLDTDWGLSKATSVWAIATVLRHFINMHREEDGGIHQTKPDIEDSPNRGIVNTIQ